jgi:hypothetical protein
MLKVFGFFLHSVAPVITHKAVVSLLTHSSLSMGFGIKVYFLMLFTILLDFAPTANVS